MRVLLAVEQLRRPVPGGIGRYATGLLGGLAALAAEEGRGPAIELLASRPPRRSLPTGFPGTGPPTGPEDRHGPPTGPEARHGPDRRGDAQTSPAGGGDPLARWGLPVRASRLPGPALTRAWDHGLLAAPRGFDVVHAVSLAAPPVARGGGHGGHVGDGGGRAGHGGGRRGPAAALVVAVHDLAWREVPEATTARGRRWHEAALGRALARASAFVTPAEPVAAALRALGAPAHAVAVVPFGADHLPPPDGAGADALLGRLGVRGPFLLSAGTLEPRKNLSRLARAYALVRPSLPGPWPLVVVGPHGWGDAGLDDGAEPGAATGTEGVLAAGPVTDAVLAALYARACAFAYVPLTEGYGLPPVEAMGAGVPVVASTGVPSVAPPAGGEPAALLVDPLSVESIAAALARAAADEPLRRELAARGRVLHGERTWRRSARAHLAVWEALA